VSTAYARPNGTSGTSPSMNASPGQVVVALQGCSGVGTSDFPITSASPALGNWSTDALLQANIVSGSMQDAWTAPSAPGAFTVTGTSAIARDWPTAMVRIG
jgi:hypothetical protein